MKINRTVQTVRRTVLLSALLAAILLFYGLYSTVKQNIVRADVRMEVSYGDDGYAYIYPVEEQTDNTEEVMGTIGFVAVLLIGIPLAVYSNHREKEKKEEEQAEIVRRAAQAATESARCRNTELRLQQEKEAKKAKAEEARRNAELLPCPGCGAVGSIDEHGCCEYCGRQRR
ncbi:MAG: hypothetical protein IJT27_07360 [Clostridia bacterium]|nr:hypothetical protein [Clostridia bacterium]